MAWTHSAFECSAAVTYDGNSDKYCMYIISQKELYSKIICRQSAIKIDFLCSKNDSWESTNTGTQATHIGLNAN